jgi:ERCC4-type nuclease
MKNEDLKIIVDTREQNPLWTNDITRTKLDVGDYSLERLEKEIAIERKSLIDLFGTLGKGHKRFKKELERSKNLKYFAIVIEGNVSDINNKKFEGSYHSKIKGFVILKILFTIHLKYKIPIFFCKDRSESKLLIKELFRSYVRIKYE